MEDAFILQISLFIFQNDQNLEDPKEKEIVKQQIN